MSVSRSTVRSTNGFFAGTGGPTPLHRVTWRAVVCPREECQAGKQERCRRRVTESYGVSKPHSSQGHQGEGRWSYLKHPHAERVRLSKQPSREL